SLGEVLAERRARLGPDAAALVNAAAVLAVPSAQTLLAESAGLDGTRGDDALTEALGAAVLHQLGPDTYGFGHVLAQEAAYDGIPGPVRSRTHRRVLEVLLAQDPPPLVQIAHHTRALGDLGAWLLRARAAADRAAAVGDHGTAAALLGEIIDQPGLTPDQLIRTAWSLAYAATAGTEASTAIRILRRVLGVAGLPGAVRGGIRASLGVLLSYEAGDLAGEEELVTALSEVGDGDPVMAARLLALLGVSETGRFSLAEQRDMVERGNALLAGNEDVQARSLLDVARFLQRCAVADPAVPGLLAALPREGGDVQVLQRTAMIVCGSVGRSLAVGHDGRAAAGIAEVRAVAPHARLPVLEIFLDAFQVELDWQAGRWDDAQRGLVAFQERHPDSLSGSGGILGTVRGLTAAARGLAARAAAEFGRVLDRDGLHLNSLGAAAGAARLHLARNDPRTAWRTLTDPLDFLGFLDRKEIWTCGWDLVPTAVETLLALDRAEEAEALAVRHATVIEGRDAPGALAEHHHCRGLLLQAADPDAAMAAF
ncbi:hypothetical protein ACWC5I_45390, partial [Kitasatospora sp. NPDC001574]